MGAEETENNISNQVDDIFSKIIAVTSPDDLAVTEIASQIKCLDTDEDLKNLVDQLCSHALKDRESAPVIGAVCGLAGVHQCKVKLRSLLLQKVQANYSERDELLKTDRNKFINSAMFLGEIYHYVRSIRNVPIRVLAMPVITYLKTILESFLHSEPSEGIDEELIVVAKQLLQNGGDLLEAVPSAVEGLVRDVTEVMVRHPLKDETKLNLLAALALLWSRVSLNPTTVHATVAAKLELSFKI